MQESLGPLSVGDFVIDLRGQSLTRLGVPVRLRRKSFHVLSILVQNRSRVVTKSELLDEIWGIAVTDDVLTGCVREVRHALGDDPHNSGMIRTVHGEGYQFVGPVREVPAMEPPLPPTRLTTKWFRWAACLAGVGIVFVGLAGWMLWSSQSIASPKSEVPHEVGWWRFDEPSGPDVMDSSGQGNPGRMQNGVRRVPGVLGSALEFDGRTGFVTGEGPGKDFPLGDSARTVTCWVKPSGDGAGDRNLLQWGNSVADPPRSTFHLLLRGGIPAWGNGYGQGWLQSRDRLVEGEWHHVAAVHNGATSHAAFLFVDGALVGETSAPLRTSTRLGMPWRIGVFMLGGAPYEGSLDDVRLLRGALTAGWIQSLYNCGEVRNRFRSEFGEDGYFVPTGSAELIAGPDGALENRKESFGAAQLAFSDGVCAMKDLRGSAMPGAYRLSMEVELPKTGQELILSAGPTVLVEQAGPGLQADGG